VVLVERQGARREPVATGLYHFAVLLPSRLELALSLSRIVGVGYPLQGAADHHVSEALYLADPDGNGIEIYRDRPRSEWRYPNGSLKMGTDPLDFESVMNELQAQHPAWEGIHEDALIGHMHLHVSNIPSAERFYQDILGLELMLRYGHTASFLSVEGYHHHLGINTWGTIGAPPPPPDSVGMRYYEVIMPEVHVQAVRNRMEDQGLTFEEQDGLHLRDPAGNAILLRTA
jgi:catechol 2,3-dioxygenase